MKALIFLLVLGAVVAVLVLKVRKSQAEEAQAKRRALERRKKKDSEALSQDTEIVWPVIIKPASGKRPPEAEEAVAEPTMTAIEFDTVEPKSARNTGS